MTDKDPVVELDHVTFGYPPDLLAQPALEDVTLRVEPLDFLGIIGPNGGGKTTLLKIMLGLLKPQRGTVKVFGKPPGRVRGRIGYVPQHVRFDSSVPVTVLDVVLMGRLSQSSWGVFYGRSNVEAAMTALRLTQTEDLAKRPIEALSGGQRQRVLIARALAADVQLLLLDEPKAGIDVHVKHGLIDLLHQLNEKLPIVLVSHDISFVSTHLKRVACLSGKMTCHAAHEISDEVITQMYHGHVRAVQHVADCPLSDPGCEHDCVTHRPDQ